MTAGLETGRGSWPELCEADVHAILDAFDRSGFITLSLRAGAACVAATKAAVDQTATPQAMPTGDGDLEAILAPSVGTLSLAGGVARTGGYVEKGALLGVIRLLTTEVEVRSEVAGTVASIAVEDGTFVEYGQPLLRLRPDAEGGPR